MGKKLTTLDIPPYATSGTVRVIGEDRWGRVAGAIDAGDSDTIRTRVYFADGQGGTYSELFTLDTITSEFMAYPDNLRPVGYDVPPPNIHYPLFPDQA